MWTSRFLLGFYWFFSSCSYFTDLFQSLLFEACGRTVNPVNGVLGLLSTGNWHICQMAVRTVLSGGTLRPMGAGIPTPQTCELASDDFHATQKWCNIDSTKQSDLEKNEMTISFNSDSEESGGSMISFDGGDYEVKTSLGGEEPKLLNLFAWSDNRISIRISGDLNSNRFKCFLY